MPQCGTVVPGMRSQIKLNAKRGPHTGALKPRCENNAMPLEPKVLDLNTQEPDPLKLPASSWWIPSLTFFVAVLAVVAALA